MRSDLTGWMRIPYLTGGRSVAGADCWGMVRVVREALRGDVLPMYSTVDADQRGDMPAVQSDFAAQAVPADPADGVIAFVFTGELCVHCGIVLALDGRLMVLDTSSRLGPVCRPIRYFERLHGDVRYYDH